MRDWQERTGLLLGEEAVAALESSRMIVVGVGGVGAAAAEMLVRAGVGHIVLIDSDTVSVSNINRQLPALHSTVGKEKCAVLKEKLLDINPELDIVCFNAYISEDNVSQYVTPCSFVIDAIDTLSPKIALIQHCLKTSISLVSSMGSGSKLDATAVRIADISKTYQCPLAHMLRKRLHKLGITTGFQAVFSPEIPRRESTVIEESRNKKSQVGTISYLPTVFGCACAQVAIRTIVGL